MGLLEDWAKRVNGPDLPPRRRPLTAAGTRINLARPENVHTRRTQWQTDAWNYRDQVPELRFVSSFISSALGRLRVFPAENRPRGEDPAPLAQPDIAEDVARPGRIEDATRDAAAAAVARLNLDQHGSTLLGRLGENLEFAGEAYLLGEPGADGEDWSIRSVTEVQVTASGATLTEPGGGASHPRHLRADECELLRLWNPHPQFYMWPDANIVAMLDTLEAMVLLSRRGRAHDRSRISSGKALYVPHEFSLTRAGSAPVSADLAGTDEDDDPFMSQLVYAMTNPIADESDASAVVPILIRGPAQLGDQPAAGFITTIDLHGEDPKDLDTRRDNLVTILARGIDLPPEVLTGLADGNHWTSAQIDANTIKAHVEPRAERMCDALTVAYLRPMLRAMGITAEQRNRVCLWFDAAELIQDPDRTQTTKDAHGMGLISDSAARRELRFVDDDAPTDVERLVKTLSAGNVYEASIPILIALSGLDLSDPKLAQALTIAGQVTGRGKPTPSPRTIDAQPATPAPPGRLPSATPGTPSPSSPGPSQGLSAAATEPARWRVDVKACRELAAIDADLVNRLLAHAESTVGRAVEKAANRIRGDAQRDPTLAAAFKGHDPRAVVAASGLSVATLTNQVVVDQLIDTAIDDFEAQWTRDLDRAAAAVDTVLARMLPEPAALAAAASTVHVAATITANARPAFQWLRGKLREHARKVLYGGHTPTRGGEGDLGIVPAAIVRGAVAQAAGIPEQSGGVGDDGVLLPGATGQSAPSPGPGTGEVVLSALRVAGAVIAGVEWVYPPAPRDHFLAHRKLDGEAFTGWDDPALMVAGGDEWIGSHYSPGDHTGCLCWSVPIAIVPMTDTPDPSDPQLAELTAQTVPGRETA